MKIAALIAARNDSLYLRGMLRHLSPYVDVLIGLDDASTEDTYGTFRDNASRFAGGAAYWRLYGATRAHWRQSDNRYSLIKAAQAMEVDWALCLDADERMETSFLVQMREIIADCEKKGIPKLRLRLREMWTYDHYRIDGPWGNKRRISLFKIPLFQTAYGPGDLHCPWTPPEMKELPELMLDFNVYHLRMIGAVLRRVRQQKFMAIDSRKGLYEYLTDETGLALESLGSRSYVLDPA